MSEKTTPGGGVSKQPGSDFGCDPFEFDDDGICLLEAESLGSVFLTEENWKTHSYDHKSEDRTYFAEFRSNREAIIEVLKSPKFVREIKENTFKTSWVFQGPFRWIYRTPGGVKVEEQSWLLTIRVNDDKRVQTFFPSKKWETQGELIYP